MAAILNVILTAWFYDVIGFTDPQNMEVAARMPDLSVTLYAIGIILPPVDQSEM